MTPIKYFESTLGSSINTALTNCCRDQPKDPIEYIACYLEKRKSPKSLKHHPASLYFNKIFGSDLNQALLETAKLHPSDPLLYMADKIAKLNAKGARYLISFSVKLQLILSYFCYRAPVKVVDVHMMTSRALLNRRTHSNVDCTKTEKTTSLIPRSNSSNSFVVVTEII